MSAQHSTTEADAQRFTERLTQAGMSRTSAEAKFDLFRQVLDAVPGASRPYLLFVPGRIEVLGKHTDYAGGRSLLAAAERGFCVAAAPRPDRRMSIVDVRQGRRIAFEVHPELVATAGNWPAYPMTVARRIARNFPGPLHGADMAFASDLPPASGMSSSSAMMIAVFKVLDRMNGLVQRPEARAEIGSPEDLAGYLATIENGRSFGALAGDRGVGTFGGSEDHTAICCCRAGHLHLYSFCPTRPERVLPMPPDHMFAVAYCGLAAEKTGAAMDRYNRASSLVAALVELWQAKAGDGGQPPSHAAEELGAVVSLADIVHSAFGAADRLREIVARRAHTGFGSDALLHRLEHFLTESEQLIPAAADALAGVQTSGKARLPHSSQQRNAATQSAPPGAVETGPPPVPELDLFGRLVDESQRGAERLLGNQVPQTVYLARSARQCGATAASAFGAGFGGSVWALIETNAADAFLAHWAEAYRGAFPKEAEQAAFFATGAGPGIVDSA